MTRIQWVYFRALLLGTLLFFLSPQLSLLASTEPPASHEQLSQSPIIVEAVVEDAAAYRPDRNPGFIRTRYQLQITHAYRGWPGRTFEISMGGGNIGDQEIWISHQPRLEIGSRYLLFLNRFAHNNALFIEFSEFGAVPVDKDGSMTIFAKQQGGVRFTPDQVAALIDAEPDRVRAAVDPADEPVMPSKRLSLKQKPTPTSSEPPRDRTGRSDPYIPVEYPKILRSPGPATEQPSMPDIGLQYYYSGRPAGGVTMERLPSEWVWSPHDEAMMAYWNQYGGGALHAGPHSDSWGFPNGVSEMVGWPSSEDLQAMGRNPWAPDDIARTMVSSINGVIVESDIALNPAKDWTLDEELATSGIYYNFRWEVLHELGHAWGLKHPWEHQNVWWPSVMNYKSLKYKNSKLHADDTEAVRDAYHSVDITDLTIDMYHTYDAEGSNRPQYEEVKPITSTARHGEYVFWNGTHLFIQNLGTTSVGFVPISYWLHPRRWSFDEAYFVHFDLALQTPIEPYSIRWYYPEFFEIPDTVPPGEYFIRLQLDNDGDDNLSNQSAFVTRQASIMVRNQLHKIMPDEIERLTPEQTINRNGEWEFLVDLEQGQEYKFNTCALADFDTMLEVRVDGQVVLSNDDACGFQSKLNFTWEEADAPDASLIVKGYSTSNGTFLLSYQAPIPGALFRDRFESILIIDDHSHQGTSEKR